MRRRTRLVLKVGLGAALVAVLALLLVFNLAAGVGGLKRPVEHRHAVDDADFAKAMGTLFGPPLVGGNRIEALDNGVEIYPAMLAAIRGAERSVTMETYVYWSGRVADRFADVLAERARAGVKVHVLLDWLGSAPMDERLLERMRAAGVEIERYHPLAWYHLDRINNRTHRKLLIIDGKVAFTGGVGIADIWRGDAAGPEQWREIQVRVEGPAVAQLQATFVENWLKTRSELLYGEDYFPALEPRGSMAAQMIASSPNGGSQKALLMYLMSIASARRSIEIGNAYFVPNELAVEMLVAARRRGVEIRILVPGRHLDSTLVRHASRACWGRLLAEGIEIWEYQPTMYHAKVMIVDGRWVTVGSINFDDRSFRLNDEANLNVLDAGFAREVRQTFVADLERARRVHHADWTARPWTQKLRDRLALGLREQL